MIGLRVILNSVDGNKGLDFIIDQAKDGQEALNAVQELKYGLIFMDCSMPVMDGYEASLKIRKLETIEQPMIVACTGHSEAEYIKKAFRHQMDELVEKPASI